MWSGFADASLVWAGSEFLIALDWTSRPQPYLVGNGVRQEHIPRDEAPDWSTLMFTMTVYAVGRAVIARGRSYHGEAWEDTLIRLYGGTLPPGDPPRRVIGMTYHEGQTGGPTNMVILG